MPLDYFLLRTVHQTAVALSFAGFFARGLGALRGAAWVRARAARTLPHLVDTVLLLSALAMLWMLKLVPAHAPWVMAKLVGLAVYIGLGVVALGRDRAPAIRGAAWFAALAVFGWIVSVAITKDPRGLFSLLA